MEQREISIEISKLLRKAVEQDVLLEVLLDINKMWEQSDEFYVPDEDFDEELDILNRN